MNKIDLIIDRLELIEKFDWNTLVVKGSVHEALAAARELRDMKPVGISSEMYPHECYLFDGVVLPPETLLYVLGDVDEQT